MIDATTAEWETVHTVHNYYDGPRNGIADYHGIPHAYKCDWDDAADDWSAVFLTPRSLPSSWRQLKKIGRFGVDTERSFSKACSNPATSIPRLPLTGLDISNFKLR